MSRAKYIEGLENRLGRMESLLKMSGLLTDEEAGKTDLGTLEKRLAEKVTFNGSPLLQDRTHVSAPSSTVHPSESNGSTPQHDTQQRPQTSITSPGADLEKEKKAEVENLSDMMCSLVTNNCGETRYIGMYTQMLCHLNTHSFPGSSSGFSIFSPKGIEWVNEKTGDKSFQQMISHATVDDNKWIYWKPEIFSDIFVRRVFKPLPPKDEALSLLRDFFENFNCMFPLFHEPTFMHLVEKQYSLNPYEGSGWWASINVALAIAHRLRVMSNLVPQDEDQKAWMYLKNAMGVLTELTMRNTDLLSVQALLGMALFLQGTPNPQSSFFLVAAAIRLSHSIGLHKRGSGFNLNPVEVEQRKRVFWIGYLLDKDICLRSGRPPAQDDDDMNVELPSEDPPDNIGNIPLADGKGKTNLFRFMCTFAIISSKVYKKLYSVSAAKQSDGELLNTIGELDKELEDWKDSIPLDFRPEHEIKASHTPLILHIVVLHFAYYNCLTTIHRMSVHHGYWTSRLSNYAIQGLNARPLNPRVFSSAALCVSAARASIHLIKYIPQGDFACVWLILYFPVSALVTLFANILQNPQDPRARADIKLMNLVCNFLSMLTTDEENGSVKRMLAVCVEFERIAKVVLDKAEKEGSKRKRKTMSDDTTKATQPTPLPNGMPATPSVQQPQANISTPGNFMSPLNGINSPQMFGTPMSNGHFGQPHPMSQFGIAGFEADFSDMPPMAGGMVDGIHMPTNGASPLNPGSFQQPFVPQDLWQMPMTFEWDWQDMTNSGSGYMPSYEHPDGPNAGMPGMPM